MKRFLLKLQLFLYTLPFSTVFATKPAGMDAGTGEACNSNFAGIKLSNGVFTIQKPCTQTSTKTFNSETWKTANMLYNIWVALYAASVVIGVISLVVGAIELATSNGNQRKKQHAITRIKSSLIAEALLGGFNVIVRLCFNFLH